MGKAAENQAQDNRRTIVVSMDDYEPASKVIAAFEALQSLRLLIQHEIVADSTELQLEQVLSSLEVVEYAMRQAVNQLND